MLVDDRPMLVEYLAFFKRRNIRVRRVPGYVIFTARRSVEKLEHGEPDWKLRGKCLGSNRPWISIPIGMGWRIRAEDIQR